MVRPTIESRTLALTGGESSLPIEDGEDADWVDSPIASVPTPDGQWKQAARAATTADVDLDADLEDGDTLDDVTLLEGDRVLVKDQADAAQNGIYIVSDTGTAARALDMDESAEVMGAVVRVIEGTANASTTWIVTNSTPPVIDDDDIVFEALATGGVSAVEDLTTVETDTTLRLAPDGAGGVEWAATGGGESPIEFGFDGGGVAILVGAKFYLADLPAGTITRATAVCDTGTITIELRKSSYSGFPGSLTSITGSAGVAITSGTKVEDGSLSGWTVDIDAGDIIEASAADVGGATIATVALRVTRT